MNPSSLKIENVCLQFVSVLSDRPVERSGISRWPSGRGDDSVMEPLMITKLS